MAITFHIIAIGKMKSGALSDLYSAYTKRLDWNVILHEVTSKTSSKSDEAKSLLAKIPEKARVIALDERGETPTSIKLSRKIEQWVDAGTQDIAFIIGGADGLDQSIHQRADYLLSFGRLTWPHMMARAMLAEQLYRIRSIMKNHPYHRE
jgi:23S rRNA (pseudouridine1915-N3)-methyltransferase